jgi:hypothetical protein
LAIQQVSSYDLDKQANRFDERLWVRVPGQVRLERWQNKQLQQVDIWSGEQWIHWRRGGKVQKKPRTPQPQFDFFGIETSGSSYGSLSTILRLMNVNYTGVQRANRDSDYLEPLRISLAWFGNGPVVVFGAAARQRKPNQLWLDKFTLMPVRFLGRLEQSVQLDVQFLDYISHLGRPVFPGRIELYRDGKLHTQTKVNRVQVLSSLPNKLFSQIHTL